MFGVTHSEALALEHQVRRLYGCDRAGVSGLADADFFESHPLDAAIMVVSYISACFSLLTAVLGGIQKFVKFDQVAERNHDAGDQFLFLIKEIDMAVALYNDTGDQCRFEAACETLTKRFGEILAVAKNAPTNGKDYAKARKGIENGEESYSEADMGIGKQA